MKNLILAFLVSQLFCASFAKAAASDALLIVGGGALGGGVLGLSTVSFYDKPGEHTKNIWVGAAIGAVAGVLIAAASSLTDASSAMEEAEEEASLFKPNNLIPEKSPAIVSGRDIVGDKVLAWQPIATIHF